MDINLVPTRRCTNLNCSECFHTPEQRRGDYITQIETLERQLVELSSIEEIGTICLFGGELLELQSDYLDSLCKLALKFSNRVQLVTNLSVTIPGSLFSLLASKKVSLCYSYYGHISKNMTRNLRMLGIQGIPLAVNVLATHRFLSDPIHYLDSLKHVSGFVNIQSVDIIPVGKTGANSGVPESTEYVMTLTRSDLHNHSLFQSSYNLTLRRMINHYLNYEGIVSIDNTKPVYLIDGGVKILEHRDGIEFFSDYSGQDLHIPEYVYKEEFSEDENRDLYPTLRDFLINEIECVQFTEHLGRLSQEEITSFSPVQLTYEEIDFTYVDEYFTKDSSVECIYPHKIVCVLILYYNIFKDRNISLFRDNLYPFRSNLDNLLLKVDDRLMDYIKTYPLSAEKVDNANCRFLLAHIQR
ncbi:hypothetical protein C3I27_03520 [Campylobacter jejuni]|uniref:Radical SAM protein n=1 Tax=Campylobacter jejuni TaxID=197 RepID=A0AAX1Z4C2_CAMJU|nr:hypothetical protein [Campylobacter jejuni]RTI48496.1 hypothetical protein C3I27_03520 [Campylobacter jejuni]